VDSIDGLTNSGHISKEFVGIILLPIVGNAAGVCPLLFSYVAFNVSIDVCAEHLTAVLSSVKDKLTLSLNVAVGSSIVRQRPFSFLVFNGIFFFQQIALFVVPAIIILGWILNKPLTLLFDPYESIVLFFSGSLILLSSRAAS
jgi:Ca2+:H+ antiporter